MGIVLDVSYVVDESPEIKQQICIKVIHVQNWKQLKNFYKHFENVRNFGKLEEAEK